MNLSKVLPGLTACLFAASLTGCFVDASSPPPERLGSITVDVTIEGTNQPAECSAVAVDQIEVTLLDSTGGVVTSVTTPCETFNLTIDQLPEDTYEAEIMLLDASGQQVSDVLAFPGADVVGNTDLVINADFPSSSVH